MPSTTSESRDPAAASPAQRRLAFQHVREARDRLTSTSGTRPVFDYELLRQFAQNRLSASPVILLLIVTIGLFSGLWTGALICGVWTGGALHYPPRHHSHLPAVSRRNAEHRESARVADAVPHARSVLRHGVDLHPDQSDRRRRTGGHVHAVRHAFGGGDIEHAGVEPADCGVRIDAAGHHRDRARFRAQGNAARLHSRRDGARRRGLFLATRLPALFDDAGDAGGPRRKGIADRRTRTVEIDLGRGAPPRRSRQYRQVAFFGADEPRAAHAAQRHPRLLRGDEGGNLRTARGADVQGLCRRHPQFRRAPFEPDQ